MRQLIKLSALSLIVFSQAAFAAEKNCLVILVGGAKEWISLLPGFDTDISIDVDAAAKKEARRTGCRVISGHNQDEAEFKAMLNRASRPPYYTAGTTVHMTFTDHGTPQPGDGRGALYIGKGIAISNSDFSKALTDNFPRGSRMTFSTNICWGSMTEMVTAYNLDSHFDICGGTSTHPKEFSWNMHDVDKDGSIVRGPYTAVGLSNAADMMKNNMRAPSVASFHRNAKLGDDGNLFRMPGFLSSTTYARNTLLSKKMRPEVDNFPLHVLFGTVLTPKEADEMLRSMGIGKMKSDILNAMDSNAKDNCPPANTNDHFHRFLKEFSGLYERLSTQVPANLPEPYKAQAAQSSRWLQANKHKLADLIANFVRTKAEYWAQHRKNIFDPKQSGAIIKGWEAIEQRLKAPFRDHLFHMRNLQETKTVADFLAVANPAEKARFNKFVACERRPVL